MNGGAGGQTGKWMTVTKFLWLWAQNTVVKIFDFSDIFEAKLKLEVRGEKKRDQRLKVDSKCEKLNQKGTYIDQKLTKNGLGLV